jgi:hypothetical protein
LNPLDNAHISPFSKPEIPPLNPQLVHVKFVNPHARRQKPIIRRRTKGVTH